MKQFGALFVFFSFVLLGSPLSGQSRTNQLDPRLDFRGKVEATVCSQNLDNYGTEKAMKRRFRGFTAELKLEKEEALMKRFLAADCDIIAVQEVLGGTETKAKESLELLGSLLQKRTNREYEAYVGGTNDKVSRVGFLVAKDVAGFKGLTSYYQVELPRIAEDQKPRYFTRGPLELTLNVRSPDDKRSRELILVAFHFKSKTYHEADPTELEWETYRMEMAEALRRIVLQRNKNAIESGSALLMLLGDRNSNFDVASARLLSGMLRLEQFQGEAPCRLSKRGVPLCQAGASQPPLFFSVLLGDEQTRLTAGTYRYNNIYSWLDDILMPATSLPFAYAEPGSEGDYASGVIREHPEASDHALTYVRLNW